MRPLPEQIFRIKKCEMMQRQYGGWEITIHCVKRDIVIYYTGCPKKNGTRTNPIMYALKTKPT